MSQIVHIEVSEETAHRAAAVAARTNRRLEEVLAEWIDRFAAEAPVETLTDAEVLALADMEMPPQEQDALSDLLARSRENTLNEAGQAQLDQLMNVYRRGLVRKAQAMRVAVERGLKAPLV